MWQIDSNIWNDWQTHEKPIVHAGIEYKQNDFVEFLRQLRGSFIEEYSTAKITLVLDNHRAHHTKNTQQFCEQHNIELLFQPPYSPEFNSIEYLWSVVKRRFKKNLISENEVHIQQQLFS